MTIKIRNTNELTQTASADWATLPTHVVLRVGGLGIDSAAIVWTNTPDPTDAPVNGQKIAFAVNALVFTLTNTGFNEAALLLILKAGRGDVTFTLSLHTGAPGSGFNANEIPAAQNPGYVRYAVTTEII